MCISPLDLTLNLCTYCNEKEDAALPLVGLDVYSAVHYIQNVTISHTTRAYIRERTRKRNGTTNEQRGMQKDTERQKGYREKDSTLLN
jgi:hypothetical protein